ncbi:class I SAM-dependent methyltransferase [Haloferula helveola]
MRNAPIAKAGLRELYTDREFVPRAFTDRADHAFISIHLIERSVALLAAQLTGELLDVGCGQQPYATYFGHSSKHMACDYDAARGNVDFSCPADAIPLPDESVDSVLCTEVLEHVPDPMAVWNEFHRILRPGGRVLLTTPQYWPPHELPYDFYRYPEHGLRRLASESGFALLALIPRGGPIAFWGQVTLHVWQPLFRFAWTRILWNRLILALDRFSNTPRMTVGWTVLAEKERS